MIHRIAVLALVAVLPAVVLADGPTQRLYKYMDAKGKTYYTQVPPAECQGQRTEVLSTTGRVVKQNEVLSPEKIAAQEAEKKKKAEAEKLANEERRRNMALLNTYSSEKDIDVARARALSQAQEAVKASQSKIAQAEKRRAGFDREKEFYVKKPLPAKLQQSMQENELDIKKERDLLEEKKKEMSTINTRYDEEKRRYLELTRQK